MTEADKIKKTTNITEVISRFVQLTKKGTEFYGICPFHNDTKSSLQVNEKKQIFKCFACSEGGDLIDFVQRYRNTDFKSALKEIQTGEFGDFSANIKKIPKKDFKIAIPENPTPKINHFEYGKPSKTWAYHDENGYIISYACRFDLENGEKEVWPYTSIEVNGEAQWRWKGMPQPRLLYNLHLIKKHPNAVIIIVEGEKCADALQGHFEPDHLIATTWSGGGNSWVMCDLSPLEDRKIILWADNDNAGKRSMAEIKLPKCRKKYIHIPEGLPEKWDVADKNWETPELADFINENKRVDPMPYQVEKKEPKKQLEKPKKNTKKESERDKLSHYFEFLGYDKDDNFKPNFYFYSKKSKQVIRLSAGGFNKMNLLSIAPMNTWEDIYVKVTKWWEMAGSEYMHKCYQKGIFSSEIIRGRGAWEENNQFIFHNGKSLLVRSENDKTKTYNIGDFKSENVYEISSDLGFKISKSPLKNSESVKLIDQFKWLSWERPESAYLLAGWCVIAPFCGALDWRPHIYLTGPAGSGKSWVADNMMRTLLGKSAINVQGVTTEAGLRGQLQNDARCVLFDEADTENKVDKERVQSVISLARSASYKDGGSIVKGTQSGGSRTFRVRSCFAVISIGVHLTQQSDFSRFSILSLKNFDGRDQDFKDFQLNWWKLVNDEFITDLHTRTFHLLPIIKKNAQTFSEAFTSIIGNKRVGDQVGTILAGAYSLVSKSEISFKDAVKWINERGWQDEKQVEDTKDEIQLFNYLIESRVRIEGGIERTISELILTYKFQIEDQYLNSETAINTLKRHGFNVVDDFIYISSTSKEIRSILKESAWGSNYTRILERLEGAEKLDAREFAPGIKSRGVKIPMSLISDKDMKVGEDDDFVEYEPEF